MNGTLNKNLPIYSIVVDDELDLEVDMVSIVKSPAIERNFLKFTDQKRMVFLSDDDKMELLGAALIPDHPIYRMENGKEFYVVFTKETIKTIAQNLFKKGYNQKMNVEHTSVDAKSYIYQSFIIDKETGVGAPEGLTDLPEGSWVIGVKVEDKDLWAEIKSGERNGFSVEGLFGLDMIDKPVEDFGDEDEDSGEWEDEFASFLEELEKTSALLSSLDN